MTNILETFSNGLGISLVVFLPLVSAIFILFIPKTQEFLIKITTLGASVVTFLLSLIVAYQFDDDKAVQKKVITHRIINLMDLTEVHKSNLSE